MTLPLPHGFPDFPPVPDGWLERATAAGERRFRYVGEEYLLTDGAAWSDNPSADKEWLIAHHKFYIAVDLARATHDDVGHLAVLRTLLESWLDEMGVGHPIQSDAQVEAKRVENWFWALSLLPAEALGQPLRDRLLDRIDDEARYIIGHLKRTRNHRTFQLYAVALAAVLSPERTGDLRAGAFTLLTENLLTDIGLDGVHGELSSHYHNLVAETAMGFLELADRNGFPLPAELRDRVHRAVTFSLWLQWPNGDLPLINDADNGRHQDLLRRGAALFGDPELTWGATFGSEGRPPAALSRGFEVSGYAILRDGWGTGAQHVLYDRAVLGEGSHSHYDLFSFTYFADGAPAVVDPGRYTYSSAPDQDGVDWRHEFKATAAHNTVTVDGLDQTRYLSRTKHGPDVEILDPAWLLGGQVDCIVAGAGSSEYAPVHRRTLFYPERGYLLLLDELSGVDGAEHLLRLPLPLSRYRGDVRRVTGGGWRAVAGDGHGGPLRGDGAGARGRERSRAVRAGCPPVTASRRRRRCWTSAYGPPTTPCSSRPSRPDPDR